MIETLINPPLAGRNAFAIWINPATNQVWNGTTWVTPSITNALAGASPFTFSPLGTATISIPAGVITTQGYESIAYAQAGASPASTDIQGTNGTNVAPIATVNGYAALPPPAKTTLTITALGSPVSGATVWITSDPLGALVINGYFTTRADGSVICFLIPGMTYYLWMTATGEQPISGQAFMAVAD